MHQIDFYETSAFNGDNIIPLFERMGELIIEIMDKEQNDSKTDLANGGKKKSKCC